MRPKRSPVLIAALLVFTCVAAGLFGLEFMAFERSHGNSLGQKLTVKPAMFALSQQANHAALRQCDRQLSPPITLTKPAVELVTSARNCAQLARHAIALMPTNGFGYFVLALADNQRGDRRSALENLGKSSAFAPSEGWLAQRRIAFAFQNQDYGETVSLDIDILLTTQAGAEILTGFYIRRPATRTAITTQLTLAGSKDQIRFINLLRKGQAKL